MNGERRRRVDELQPGMEIRKYAGGWVAISAIDSSIEDFHIIDLVDGRFAIARSHQEAMSRGGAACLPSSN